MPICDSSPADKNGKSLSLSAWTPQEEKNKTKKPSNNRSCDQDKAHAVKTIRVSAHSGHAAEPAAKQ